MDKTTKEWDEYIKGKDVVKGVNGDGRTTATVGYAGRTEDWTYWVNIDTWVYNG